MNRYVIPKGTQMYVATDEDGMKWPMQQPRGYHNLFQSAHEVVYTDRELVKTIPMSSPDRGMFVFKLPPNEFGEFLMVGFESVKVEEE